MASGFFAVLVVVLASMSFHGGPRTGRVVAAGVIWLSVAFATVLALGKDWAREREGKALVGLVTSPLEPSALFVGKVLGLLSFLAVIEVLVLPLAALFFGVDLLSEGAGLLVLAFAATPGVAAAGTLFGVMTVRTRARDLALAIVLLPLLSPVLLAAIAGTRALLDGAELSTLGAYLRLIGVFDLAFFVAGATLFGSLVED